MIRAITLFLLLALLTGCANNQMCVIEGRLPDGQYNGEMLYLVPFVDIGPAGVDSVMIQNNAFRFERPAEKEEIMIIRMRPLLRLRIQELLIVSERGQIQVTLDSVSSASGTPQNEDLQRWKEIRASHDEAYYMASQMKNLHTTDDSLKEVIRARQEELQAEMSLFNYELVKKNNLTTLGDFIYSHFGKTFTSEQKKELNRE